MAKKRRSKQDKFSESGARIFIGREEPIRLFRKHLECKDPESADFIDILNVYGQGGVGKSYLCEEFQNLAKKHSNVLLAYTDEGVRNVLEFMSKVADRFATEGFPLKAFANKYKVYLQEKEKLEKDPEAPKGWVGLVAKTAVKSSLKVLDHASGGIAKAVIDSEAAGEKVAEIAQYLYSKKTNVDEVELVLEPVKKLTPLFIDDLYEYEEEQHLCLIADNYETTSAHLDEWIFKLYKGEYGETPINLTFVISGREELDSNRWAQFNSFVRRVPLSEFTEEEALAYLRGRKITDPDVIEAILKLSARLPILMATLALEAPTGAAEVKDLSANAVERFLRWISDEDLRDFALQASVPRILNEDIISLLVPEGADPAAYFAWLRERPFVQIRGGHWTYHPIVRDLMLRYLQQKSPNTWRTLNQERFSGYYQQQMELLGIEDRDDKLVDERWQGYALEFMYHQMLVHQKQGVIDAIRTFAGILRLNPLEHCLPWARSIVEAEQVLGINYATPTFENDLFVEDEKAFLQIIRFVNDGQILIDQDDQAFFYKSQGDLLEGDESVFYYHKAINLKPDYPAVHFNLGYDYAQQNNFDLAISHYKRAIEIKPDYAYAYNNLGVAYANQEKFNEAIPHFKKATELEPDYANAHDNLGLVYARQQDFDKAIPHFKKATELEPDYAYAHDNLGLAYSNQQDFDKAVSHFKKAIELKPDHASAHNNLGVAYSNQQNIDQAIQHFKKAIDLKPEEDQYWHNLGWWSLVDRQVKDAEFAILKSWDISKNSNGNDAMNMGHICLFKNEFTNAVAWYQKSLGLMDSKVFFDGMNQDFLDLKMEERGISKAVYQDVLKTLRENAKADEE